MGLGGWVFVVAGTEKATESEAASLELDEHERLIAWQFLMLLDLGFSIEEAQRLVAVPGLSWHAVDDLMHEHPDWPHSVITDELT